VRGVLPRAFRAFSKHNMQFRIATDGAEVMRTNLGDEFDLVLWIGALDETHPAKRTLAVRTPAFDSWALLRTE
jgi:hypothetical protein